MAYESKNLSALSYSNGFTLWHYRTADLVVTVDDADYFNGASSMLREGDFIFVNAGVDNAPTHGVVVVVANQNDSIDVSNVIAFGTLNTD